MLILTSIRYCCCSQKSRLAHSTTLRQAALDDAVEPLHRSVPIVVGEHPLAPGDLGLVLVPNVLERTPPFVDAVRADSPAAKAGIHADDLIVYVENQLVQSCGAVVSEFGHLERDTDVHVVLIRNGELVEVVLRPGGE